MGDESRRSLSSGSGGLLSRFLYSNLGVQQMKTPKWKSKAFEQSAPKILNDNNFPVFICQYQIEHYP